MSDHSVRLMHARCTQHLEQIAELFKKDAKITLVVRMPGFPERDVLLTDDTIEGIAEVLERSKSRAPTNGG